MPEKFAFDQGFGNGRAVDLDKGRIFASAAAVKLVGNQFLACPIFPVDQNGRLSRSHFAHHAAQLLDRGTFSNQFHAFHTLLGKELIHLHQLAIILRLLHQDIDLR